jgi:hypothetical protein
MEKEVAAAYFEVQFNNLLVRIEKVHENLQIGLSVTIT